MHRSSAVIAVLIIIAIFRGWDWGVNRTSQCKQVFADEGGDSVRVESKALVVKLKLPDPDEVIHSQSNVVLCGSETLLSSSRKVYWEVKPYLGRVVIMKLEGEIGRSGSRNVVKIDTLVDLRESNTNTNWYINLKTRLMQVIADGLPEPHGSLLVGLLLGDQGTIPSRFKDQMITTGTYHLAAASGYNVSVVAAMLLSIMSLISSRRKQLLSVVIGGWMYVLLAGASPSLVRAMLMFSTIHVALLVGRLTQTLRSLILSLACMLVINPAWWFDMGTWLSFGSTLGIVTFVPLFHTLISMVTRNRWENQEGDGARISSIKAVVEALTTSIAATLGVIPITLGMFGQVSLVGFVATAALSALVAPLTIIGVLKIVFGGVSELLGRYLGHIAWVMLDIVVRAVEYLSRFSASSIEITLTDSNLVESMVIVSIVGYYTMLIYLATKAQKWKR